MPATMNPATPGPMYDAGGVSGTTKENTLMPAAVSQAGTNTTMPRTGTMRCRNTFHRPPLRLAARAKYPMHAAFIRM